MSVPLVELADRWAVLADLAVWTVAGFGIGFLTHRMGSWFRRDSWITRSRWFDTARLYERSFKVRRWKDRLPEAGAFFADGFSKRRLEGNNLAYLDRFVIETRRAEVTHWLLVALIPAFFLWNPLRLAAAMAVYGLVANVPCILIQRYNRLRLQRVQGRARRISTSRRGPG